jgi:hypothetical protein
LERTRRRAYPISTVSERDERLGWNPKTGTLVRNRLFEQDLLTFEPVATLTGRIKMLTLTPRAETLLSTTVRSRRRGGAAHEYWREQCHRWLRRHAYAVTEEHPVGEGKTVDLYGTNATDTIIMEIETGKGDIPATIAKLATLPGRRVLFIINEETAREYEAATNAIPGLELWTPHHLRADKNG